MAGKEAMSPVCPVSSRDRMDEGSSSSMILTSSLSGRSMLLAVLVIFISVVIIACVPAYISHNPTQDIYSVIFDAGSTGSRLFVFHFKPRGSGVLGVVLVKEVFHYIEPGISAYAHNPSKAATTLQPLFDKALESVPLEMQPLTLVTFKATAGLRMVPKNVSDQIILEIREALKEMPFYLPDLNSINVMSGEDEGLFAWLSVNFLLDLLSNTEKEKTVTTIDLGGGSIQMGFEVSNLKALGNILVSDIIKISLQHSEFFVFTKSYLGYGLKSARLGVMGVKEGLNGDLSFDEKISDQLVSGFVLRSACYQVGFHLTFQHNSVNYVVKGSYPDPNVTEGCVEAVNIFVQSVDLIESHEMNQREIHLFSYFFDVASWAGLVPAGEYLKNLTPNDFLRMAAAKYCHKDHFVEKHPFLCIDLLYVHSFLTVGLGLRPDTKLHVEKKLLGKEVSWALGAALATFSENFSFSSII